MGTKKTAKKNKEFEMAETKEMDLNPLIKSDLDILTESFPEKDQDTLKTLLESSSLAEATEILDSEVEEIEDETVIPEPVIAPIVNSSDNNKPEVIIMSEETTNPEVEQVDVDEMFNQLMSDQEKMQKSLEKKKGGVVTVDDTHERADRATQISRDGRRKGKVFKPNKGVASFMAVQNAKYKASGKPAPYSNECIKNTLMREHGQLEGKKE